MADKNFGVKEINLIGASGTPTIDSPNNLNINAVNVAISTDMTIGGTVNSSITVGSGYTFYGDGSGLSGVVTSIVAGTNITLTGGPTGIVTINSSAGAGYSDTDVDTHINVSTASTGEVLSWTGSDYDWVAQLGTRQTFNGSTSSTHADDADESITITAYKTYSLLKLNVSHPAWVRMYPTTAARTADASRTISEDPTPGSGVIAEAITTTNNEDVLFTPGLIGFNDDSTPSTNVYLAVMNKTGITTSITVTMTAIQLES